MPDGSGFPPQLDGRCGAADFVTVATCLPNLCLGKRVLADGTVLPADRPKHFQFRSEPVSGLSDIHELLTEIGPHSCLILGRLKADLDPAGWHRRLLYPDKKTGDAATIDKAEHRYLIIDFERDCPADVDPLDPSQAGPFALSTLPPELREADCIWQLTGSAGIKPGVRLRLIFGLDRPIGSETAAAWLAGIEGVDGSIYSDCQCIYTAAPIFEAGATDPVKGPRTGLHKGAARVVPVPAIELPPKPEAVSGEPGERRHTTAADYVQCLHRVSPCGRRAEWFPLVVSAAQIDLDDMERDEQREVTRCWFHCEGEFEHLGPEPAGAWRDDDEFGKAFDTEAYTITGLKLFAAAERARQEEIFGKRLDEEQSADEPQAAKPDRFPIFDTWTFRNRPLPSWIIDGVLRDMGVVVIGGPSETFKTFIEMDALLSVASGLPFLAHFDVCRTGDAVLCLDENPDDAMRARFPAWCKARGIKDPDARPLILPDGSAAPGRFVIIPCVPLASEFGVATTLVKAIRDAGLKPAMIGIDTAAKSMRGLNQNDAKDWGLLFAIAGELRREFGCTVVIIHHSTKEDASDLRGSGAIYNDSDQVILMNGDKRTLRRTVVFDRMKDAAAPASFDILGRVYETGVLDPQGKPIASLAFSHAGAPRAVKPPKFSEDDAVRTNVIEMLHHLTKSSRDCVATIRLAMEIHPQQPDEPSDEYQARLKLRCDAMGRATKDKGVLRDLVRRTPQGDRFIPLQWCLPDRLRREAPAASTEEQGSGLW